MIFVYRDWSAGQPPILLGELRVRRGRTGGIFEFAYRPEALIDPNLENTPIDPRLRMFGGPQFPPDGRSSFGVFEDSSPDRWGKTLIKRRFDRDVRDGTISSSARLGASDYLLGVHDPFRSGALRYKTAIDGAFLDDRDGRAAPPFVRLRELEAACRAVESDPGGDDPAVDEWLHLLLAPGASLGGARPKATVADVAGNLWIAKFPSVADRRDVGAWELVAARLAQRCGLRTSASDARTLASSQHTFLTQRFDRTRSGTRIHFASAMTLTGHVDGDDASTGASYLEIAEVISSQGAAPTEDLRELWSRVAFNVMISNTDDHLRNHGFLLEPGAGWRLSPMFDVNPAPNSFGLCLNIDENDNALDLDLVRSVARYFRVKDRAADAIIAGFAAIIRDWRTIANEINIGRSEQSDMADAFKYP